MTYSIETQTQVTVENCNAQLDAGFAAWLLALGVRVESISASGEVVMRMPFSDAITRQPGIVCGQAIMSLIDTCMVMVCWAGMGRIGNCTTVNQNTNFTRAAGAGVELIATGTLSKNGRQLVFGDVTVHEEGHQTPVATASLIYMVLER